MKKKIVISCLGVGLFLIGIYVGFQLKNQNEEIVEESSTILSGDSETEKKHVFLIKTVKR
ncbi:hypothetical protein [Vagococcus sp.]|uniref:hypothetical protein n=1 Tax=Vagococcus sp. TaxID=1933889 RepID=UPI002FCBED9B